MPLTPTAWPLAAAAPALGLVGPAGLAGAWPALAGLAPDAVHRDEPRWPCRAGSGRLLAAGAIGALHGRFRHGLYAPKPRGPRRGAWSADSLSATVHQLFPAYVHTGVLLGAAAWALAALLVPYSDPRPFADRRRLPGAGLARSPRSRRWWSGHHDHHNAGQLGGAIKQRLPTTSAEIVGAVAGALVLLLWLDIIRFRSPGRALGGSTDQAP